MTESLDSWFKREVLPHESGLRRYLTRVWPRADEVPDLCQETLARVYEAACVTRPQSVRSFTFTTAHNLILDRIRRERVVSIEAIEDVDALNVLVDEISPERRVSARQELKRLVRGFDCLPPRCRQILWMRRVLDISQKDVAKRLGIQEKAVEKQVAKGGRMLTDWLNGNASAEAQSSPLNEGAENERG